LGWPGPPYDLSQIKIDENERGHPTHRWSSYISVAIMSRHHVPRFIWLPADYEPCCDFNIDNAPLPHERHRTREGLIVPDRDHITADLSQRSERKKVHIYFRTNGSGGNLWRLSGTGSGGKIDTCPPDRRVKRASYCNKIQHIDLSFCVDVTLDGVKALLSSNVELTCINVPGIPVFLQSHFLELCCDVLPHWTLFEEFRVLAKIIFSVSKFSY